MLRLIVDWVGRVLHRSQPESIVISGCDTVVPETEPELRDAATPTPGITEARPLNPDLATLEDQLQDSPTPNPGELGVRFQRREFRKLLKAVGHWPTIEFSTANGSPIDSMRDVPRGADGGIDVVIRIVADTELGAKRIAGRIRNMIVRQAY